MREETQGIIALSLALILASIALLVVVNPGYCVNFRGEEEKCFETKENASRYIEEYKREKLEKYSPGKPQYPEININISQNTSSSDP